MYHYLNLYSAYHRLLSSTLLPAISDFVKFGFNPEKYEKKMKINNHMLYRKSIL